MNIKEKKSKTITQKGKTITHSKSKTITQKSNSKTHTKDKINNDFIFKSSAGDRSDDINIDFINSLDSNNSQDELENKKTKDDDKKLYEKRKHLLSSLNLQNLENYNHWINKEYLSMWNYNDFPKHINIDTSNSSAIRFSYISSMKYSYLYNTMDMIVVIMKLFDYKINKEINFATLFCELGDNMIPVAKHYFNHTRIGNVFFTFYNSLPSYTSCDGEYRSQFCIFLSVKNGKLLFRPIWEELEEYVTKIKADRKWSLYASYFYPKMEQENKNTEVEFAISRESVINDLLIISWFNAVYDELLGITKAHVNQNFKDIILAKKEEDIEFIKRLIIKYGFEVRKFKKYIETNNKNYQSIQKNIQCGYKMIPLNVKEIQDPLKLRYNSWREYLVSNKCNNLVINCISPSFSIILDWFYIKNSRKGLYDNKTQFDKMKNSELAKNILQTLYEAQRGTYFAAENLKTMTKSADKVKKWISNKFRKLSEKIDDSINYSIEEIIMSEVTLAFVNEYIGRTVADTINIIQNSPRYNKVIGYPLDDSGYKFFAKYIFEIIYGLYCINTKLGIIHGDFHLNNATIGLLYKEVKTEPKKNVINATNLSDIPEELQKELRPKDSTGDKEKHSINKDKEKHSINKEKHSKKKDQDEDEETTIDKLYDVEDPNKITPYVIYKINDDKYTFPNNNYFGCLIDFSRCLINPNNYKIFTDERLPSNFSLVSNEEKFITTETLNLLNLYLQLFPGKQSIKDELIVIFKNYYDAVFKILTSIDMYMFSVRMNKLLNQIDYKVSKQALELISNINRITENYISEKMNNLISDPVNYSRKILEDDFPNLTIIKKYFSNFKLEYEEKNIKVVNDFYNYNNEFKFSLNSWEEFPDIIKTIKFLDPDAQKITEDIIINEKRKEAIHQYQEQKLKNMKMVEYISIRHTQKLA